MEGNDKQWCGFVFLWPMSKHLQYFGPETSVVVMAK